MSIFLGIRDEILGNRAATRPPEVLKSSLTTERATEDLDLVDDEQEHASGLVVGGGGNIDGEDSLIKTPSTILFSNISEEGEDNNSTQNSEDGEEPPRKKLKVPRTKKASTVEKVLDGMMEKFFLAPGESRETIYGV